MSEEFPKQFGKYLLMRKIAMGGMAEIFRAKTVGAEGFEKDIVIKRILPHYTEDEDFVKMFIDEARIAAKLQHANIVQIFDFNVLEGSYYIAMEYVEGKDLKKLIEDGVKGGVPLSPAQCVWIIMEISKGLHYAHTKADKGKPLNIVHRDISPQNAMVSFNGEVKLMDFGIAKAASRSTKTVAGTVKGKCAYMSPEQARGKPLDGRSDLFALGVVLWEMLTHKRLFLGDTDFVTLSNVLKMEAPPPSSLNPEVPAALDQIVLTALAKDRDDRHADVEAFNRALTKWFYANVDDLDAAAIKPWMQRMYAADVADLQAQYHEEKQAVANFNFQPVSDSVVAPLPTGGNFDPQSANTVLDDSALTAEKVREALAAARGGSPSRPSIRRPTGQQPVAPQSFQTGSTLSAGTGSYQQPRKGKGGLIAAIAAGVLVLGGVGAFLAFGGGGDPDPGGTAGTSGKVTEDGPGKGGKGGSTGSNTGGGEPEVEKDYALTLKVDPPDALVTVDGKAAPKDLVVDELEEGARLVIVARKDGYEEFKQVVEVKEKDQEYTIKLKKEEAPIEKVTLVIKTDDKNSIIVNGTELGKGTKSYEGPVGEKLDILIKPPEGDAIKKSLTLEKGMPLLELGVAASGVSGAQILLTVSPEDAKLESDKGEIKKQPDGSIVITGLGMGDKVNLKATRSGYHDWTEEIEISQAMASVQAKLRKKEERGPGTLFINAKPWAKVKVDGQPKGTTPVSVTVMSGRHTVEFLHKGQKKVKKYTVRAGRKTTAFVQF